MGMGQMGAICGMAWNQGDDLYSYDSKRFLKAAQYVATYDLGNEMPFSAYTWGSGQNCAQNSQTAISAASRGQVRPVWALRHYHYNRRLSLDDRYVSQMCFSVPAPEGGGGDYGSTSGGYDQLGFGTLMYAKQPCRRLAHRNIARCCGALVIPVRERGEGLVSRWQQTRRTHVPRPRRTPPTIPSS